ncbi:MAG: M23 family metallopeptidase [Acidobacteria bacterium]|nr:M23 family metallopeptidase [Acidobacteriota bacterium]
MRVLLTTVLLSVTLTAGQAPVLSVQAAARAIEPGEVVRLTLTTAIPVTAVTVRAFDTAFTPFRLDDRTWQVLVGVDLDVRPGRHIVSIVAADATQTWTTTRTLVVADKAFPTRRLTVEPKYVEPPPDVTQRILAEAGRLNAIWASRSPERLWSGAFAAPVPDRANSAFGSRSVFNGQPRSPHGGADFASPSGRVIRAPNGGRVVLAEDLYFTGQSVVLDHGLGLVSLFAHLSSIDVHPGTIVSAGDALGRVGATGRVTGPHLHWTVRLAGARVDPLSLMDVTGLPDNATLEAGLLP